MMLQAEPRIRTSISIFVLLLMSLLGGNAAAKKNCPRLCRDRTMACRQSCAATRGREKVDCLRPCVDVLKRCRQAPDVLTCLPASQ